MEKLQEFEASRLIQSKLIPKISVVIPTYNERESVGELVLRIHQVFKFQLWDYEIIFVDDYSQDGTFEFTQNLAQEFPIQVFRKKGRKGKAFSLLEGFAKAKGDILVMIDADLQYPPEAISELVVKLQETDIAVGNRVMANISTSRKYASKFSKYFFGGYIFGLHTDMQSGLKAFRREVFTSLSLRPTQWGFDYEFLFKAKRAGWTMEDVEIAFTERQFGESKVRVLKTGFELAYGMLRFRLQYLLRDVFRFLERPYRTQAMLVKIETSQDYLFRPSIQSFKKAWYPETFSFLFAGAGALVGVLFLLKIFFGWSILVTLSGFIAFFYLGHMLFKLVVVQRSLRREMVSFSEEEIAKLKRKDLPFYTILIPLYQEAAVAQQIIRAMSAIDYPAKKLEIIITLEEYDYETREAIAQANPPSHFRIVTLPNVAPKTKPKALNVAFPATKGEYVVIYDAEIIPDADQLKKAVLAFKKYPKIGCLQTRLDHYNAEQNILTRLFNIEFNFYYDLFLPGLQEFGFPIPLSGHSTHFRRSAIKKVKAWDPYNVAEDCDMGIALFRKGYRTEILDSISKEEATPTLSAWMRQRSRWMKGFLQGSIVHLRTPRLLNKELGGFVNFIAFLLIVPGTVLLNFINLAYWVLLVGWFTTHSPIIQQLFVGPILPVSIIASLGGNALFIYFNLLGSYRRKKYSLVKYALLSPLYWILLAVAGGRAVFQLLMAPYQWEKTAHGTHLAIQEDSKEPLLKESVAPLRS